MAEPGLDGVYHCMSRVVGATHLLDDLSKEKLVHLLTKLADFCEVHIFTYCIMSNHFHLLIRVPPPRDSNTISDAELLQKIVRFYGEDSRIARIAHSSVTDGIPIPEAIRKSVISRLRNLSAFLQEFKQRFSRWYNHRHDRSGYFWAERFKSVLIEDSPATIRTVAAYIDLNPVRAGMVVDPGHYEWCGYAAALNNIPLMQSGLQSLSQAKDLQSAIAEYRELLFITAGRSGSSEKASLDPKTILEALGRGEELMVAQALRLHIRHMSDGVALGSKVFIEKLFAERSTFFRSKRTKGAHPVLGKSLHDLSVIRNSRRDGVQ